MIKIDSDSTQTLSKDNFVVEGTYVRIIKLFGIKLWKINSKVANKMDKKNLAQKESNVGFGK